MYATGKLLMTMIRNSSSVPRISWNTFEDKFQGFFVMYLKLFTNVR
jgi:hypothetical protein